MTASPSSTLPLRQVDERKATFEISGPVNHDSFYHRANEQGRMRDNAMTGNFDPLAVVVDWFGCSVERAV